MTVIADMRTILANDAELAAILPGGILDSPLTPKTPGIWNEHAITAVKSLIPCAVMLDPQHVDSPIGLNPERRLDTDLYPELYIYATRTDMAATFDAADTRAMELLHGQVIGLVDVEAMGFRAAPLESDELPGDIWHIFRRYRVQMSHHIQEV